MNSNQHKYYGAYPKTLGQHIGMLLSSLTPQKRNPGGKKRCKAPFSYSYSDNSIKNLGMWIRFRRRFWRRNYIVRMIVFFVVVMSSIYFSPFFTKFCYSRRVSNFLCSDGHFGCSVFVFDFWLDSWIVWINFSKILSKG